MDVARDGHRSDHYSQPASGCSLVHFVADSGDKIARNAEILCVLLSSQLCDYRCVHLVMLCGESNLCCCSRCSTRAAQIEAFKARIETECEGLYDFFPETCLHVTIMPL